MKNGKLVGGAFQLIVAGIIAYIIIGGAISMFKEVTGKVNGALAAPTAK